MKIQKGLVKYKDRNDIVCTYGITDDGRQLYFLNDSKLSNDNVIVTTTLVEAIDPSAIHSHVGVCNQDGNDVIPCVNKSIKLITKELLLVEPSEAVSSSVKEANNNKKDPVEAQKLVNASATIKDNIFKSMGSDGRFIFNDLFSEATLCDLDGNNLVEGKYYSFIAINKKGDTMYLAGNTIDSPVDSFSLVTNKLNDDVVVNQDIVVPDVETPPVDVSDVKVEQDSIDNAMEISKEEVATPVESAPPIDNTYEEVVPVSAPVEPNFTPFDTTTPPPIIGDEELVEDKVEEVAPVENAIEDVEIPVEEAKEEPVDVDIKPPVVEEEVDETLEEPEPVSVDKIEEDEYEPLSLPEEPLRIPDEIESFDNKYEESFDDILGDTNINSYRSTPRNNSNIMMEAANTISRLIDVNTNQKNELNNYKDQVRQLTTLNKKVVDKARRDLDRVKSTISSKDNEIDLLKSRIQDIESELRDRERKLNNQKDELSSLRTQVEGRNDLQKVLADADSYLGGE